MDELSQLDRKVAELIGEDWAWSNVCQRADDFSQCDKTSCNECKLNYRFPKHFTTDSAAAWKLLEWATKHYMTVEIHIALAGNYAVDILEDKGMTVNRFKGKDDDIKVALTLAVRDALGKEGK